MSAAPAPGRRYGRWAALAAAALLCGSAGWAYARAAGDETRARAQIRDTALAAGRQHLAGLSSLDAARPDASLRQWLAASAGDLRAELERAGRPGSRTSVRATVTDAALTALDTRAGTAGLIATVRVDTAPPEGGPGSDRKRLEATLARTRDGWKVTGLLAVPVGGS
ncbi:hypothetical protein [Streptomyces sp. NPDC050856]|uniref:hypothetical protein n=1 Tax=Streptomyces sp. NPDC050856 TaxID=3154939 RepID=UPI0033E3806C